MKCNHEHTHDAIKESSYCRYVPSTWGRDDDADPFETVIVTDRYVWCDDCGECVDCICGD